MLPTRYGVDSALASAAESLIKKHITDPAVRLDEIREMTAMGALAARQWAYRWEYDPPSKKILASPLDGRSIGWSDGFHTPHDPRCPEFWYELRLPVDQLQDMRGWRNTSRLNGDDGQPGEVKSSLPSGAVDLSRTSDPAMRASQVFRRSTIVFLYERNRKVETRKEKPGTARELTPGDQYFACMNQDGEGCGYKSQTADELVDEGQIGSVDEMPQDAPDGSPAMPNGCPDCNNDLHLVTNTVTDIVTAHKNRLTIFAPYDGGGGVILWQGPWPHGTSTLPVVIYTNQLHPTKPMGQSETSLNWTYQVGHNLVMRIGLEHMLLAKPYMQIPEGCVDYMGQPWQFGEAQGLGIYTRPTVAPGSVSVLQAPGLPPAWATLERSYDAELRQDMGTTDFALSPDQTRNVPVGTQVIQQQEGEVPIVAKTERWQFEDGVGLNHVYELMRAVLTDEDVVELLGEDGLRYAAMLRAADLPPAQVTITTDPNTLQIRNEDVDALLKLASAPPPARKFLGRKLNVDPKMIAELEADEKAFAESQAPQPGLVNGIPRGQTPPPGLPPAIAQRMNGGLPANGQGPPAMAPALTQ